MNLVLTEEQESLRLMARDFLEKECPMSTVRELMESELGNDPALWKKMAELGWLGLLIPEGYGGAGLTVVELAVLLEEMGGALLPSAFFGNLLGTLAVMGAGSDGQKDRILTAVAAGDHILTLAVTEEAGTESTDNIRLRAEKQGGGFRLSGVKLFVPDAGSASSLVVVARTGGEGESGISLVLVERDAPGMEITPLRSIDQTRSIYEVRFDRTPGQLLGPPDGGWPIWEWVRDAALIALSADAVGGSARVLDNSVRYAMDRVQFGRPIGANQAIKHTCADMLIEVASSRSITQQAAWAFAQGAPQSRMAAAMAKARTGDAYRRVSAEGIQIHGGVGFTWEYDCHLYFKRAKVDALTFGTPGAHRERVAQLMDL
jgi:alkylation response protein AidB-like acyl-CoA dehydrogenase